MTIELRTVVVVAITLMLHFLIAELNHYLSPLHVYLYAGGLLITFPCLRFRYSQGFGFVCLTALFHDSATPTPFGTSLILFLTAHAVIYALRSRFPREGLPAAIGVALVLNALLFLALSLMQVPDAPLGPLYWRRILVDLALSQTAVLLMAGWFFSLQNEALRFFGIHLDQEQRQAR